MVFGRAFVRPVGRLNPSTVGCSGEMEPGVLVAAEQPFPPKHNILQVAAPAGRIPESSGIESGIESGPVLTEGGGAYPADR